MKQQVINYECDIIHREEELSESCYRVYDPHSYRYGVWKLYDMIGQFVQTSECSIRWIGCDPNAHILSFFYCVLVGCLQDYGGDELFIKLKYCLYQQSKQVLTIAEQKIFIEHLCLIEDSKNIGEFLKRSNHLQPIFMKIFIKKCETFTKKHISYKGDSKMQQLQKYSKIFSFINYQAENERCASVLIKNTKFLIIQEKQCFFVVEQHNGNGGSFKKAKQNKYVYQNQFNQNYIGYCNKHQILQDSWENKNLSKRNSKEESQDAHNTNKTLLENINKPIKQRHDNCPSLYCLPNQLYNEVKKIHIISKKQKQQQYAIDNSHPIYVHKQQKPKTSLATDKTVKIDNNHNFCIRTTIKCEKNKTSLCDKSKAVNKQRSLSDQFIKNPWDHNDVEQNSFGKIQNTINAQEIVLQGKDDVSENIPYESLKSNRTFQEVNTKQSKKKYYNFPHFLRNKGENNSQITFRPSPHSHSPKSMSINKSSVSAKKKSKKKITQIKSHKQLHQPSSEICYKKYSKYLQKN